MRQLIVWRGVMINQTQTIQTKAGHRPASKQVISSACPAIGFASKPRRCQPLSSCLFCQDVPSLSRSPHEMRRRCPCPCSPPSPSPPSVAGLPWLAWTGLSWCPGSLSGVWCLVSVQCKPSAGVLLRALSSPAHDDPPICSPSFSDRMLGFISSHRHLIAIAS